MHHKHMNKKYKTPEEPTTMVEESTMSYNESVSHVSPATSMSTREKLKMNTMSVDEYFDELIDQVRHDYAAI